MEKYEDLVARKKEIISEIERVKENILLRSKEADVTVLSKQRDSHDSWSTHYSEGVDRYSKFADNYRKDRDELIAERSKLEKGFFKRLFKSSEIDSLNMRIQDLDKRIETQEANVQEQKLKAELEDHLYDTTYTRSNIWEFLQSRGLTEESYLELIKTIPDMETLEARLAELERELESIDISLEAYDNVNTDTKLQEAVDKIVNYNIENPNNEVVTSEINIDGSVSVNTEDYSKYSVNVDPTFEEDEHRRGSK